MLYVTFWLKNKLLGYTFIIMQLTYATLVDIISIQKIKLKLLKCVDINEFLNENIGK